MRGIFIAISLLVSGCGGKEVGGGVDRGMLRAFAPLPGVFASRSNPITPEKVELGRTLYHDSRLSKAGDISCASCHPLGRHGADGKPVSEGHNGQFGARNSPTVLNAAGQIAQFWDGRASTIEEQAKGPLLNPVEMAMDSAAEVEARLRAIPEYAEAFARAFPGQAEPITFDNVADAIGSFERTLVTPSRWDNFLRGDDTALTEQELAGFAAFVSTGCVTCHRGSLVGGEMFNRLGVVKPWPGTSDPGRYAVTRNERDRLVFKVPPLRNVSQTAPYFHDGSVPTLDDAIRLMAEYQLGVHVTGAEAKSIAVWLECLSAPSGSLAPTR